MSSRYSDERVSLPSTGTPKFVMTGIDRPGGGVRLYASRDLKNLNWGQRDSAAYSGTAWHIGSDMQHVLVIDAPTWGEAFARAFEIWANQDKARAGEEREIEGRKTLAEGRRIMAERKELEEGRRNAVAANEAYRGARGSIEKP